MNSSHHLFNRIALVLPLLVISASAFAEDTRSHLWLERMASAMKSMSYQGTFVYSSGGSLEAMRITHIVDEDGTRERLYSVNGPQREVIRDAEGVRCVLADDKAIMEDPLVSGALFPEIPLEALGSEDAPYTIQTGTNTRVAGHNALKVSIKPKDEFRYGYNLWLDHFSGMLLKWELYDNSGNSLARLMFTELNLGKDIRMDELISDTPSDEFVKLESRIPDRRTLTRAKPKWKPASVPPGFKLTSHSVQEEQGESVFEHLVYSDGLASVSVYVEDQEENPNERLGASKIGTANAFTRHVGSKHVTVIGEVPKATVYSIGNAVVPPAGNP